MPPAKSRVVHDDSKLDSASLKDKHSGSGNTSGGRGRRNGTAATANGSSLKEVMPAPTDVTTTNGHSVQSGQQEPTGISWPNEELPLLQQYRIAYRLDTPAAFNNPLAHVIMGNPGIGRYSPTMAHKKSKRRVSKDQLALAVRKNFNGLAVNENDVIVDVLYKMRTQDKAFRKRFPPPQPPQTR
ncbi:hypothetical protein BDY21DRAFT_367521 [Lineolata rhizophorae]|uniref:Histone deacetylase complex subunit SAP30 Sin3 binding domain-containing protein n=1 Tax=Lineolata rhizophorae TaxID=578093 RepID=A0A6A6NN92_9PEZI|nr:hypothetical protein BDY21DRAFT_367521 [Lineolata rhizophorae]